MSAHVGEQDRSSPTASLFPGDLALLLIPLHGPTAACNAPGKQPVGGEWNKKAIARFKLGKGREEHLSEIEAHVSGGGNVGWVVPPGVLILDADNADSVGWLHERLPDSPCQRTSNGAHFFCKAPTGGLSARTKVELDDGIEVDLRAAEKSQVVVEPSVHASGVAYEFIRPLAEDLSQLPKCPLEIVERLVGTQSTKSAPSGEAFRDDACEPFYEGTRNTSLFKAACRIRETSRSEEEFLHRLHETNQTRCHPPLPESEVEDIARSVTTRVGLLDLSNFDRVVPKGVAGGEPRRRIVVPFKAARAIDDLEGLSAPYWIKGVVERGATGFVYGPHSSGKTFWVMRAMGAVADGVPFLDRRVDQGLVFYMCGEGSIGIDRRVLALRKRGYLDTNNLFVRPVAPNLLDNVDVGEVIEMIQAIVDEHDLPVALVVIDTLSRAMPGGDENPGPDTSKAIASADQIRTAFPGSSVLIVAHTGKDQSRGLRGHSNQAANAEFLVKIKRDLGNPVSSWEVEKQKDGESTAPEGYRLDVVNLGVEDVDGEPITSCVMVPTEIGPGEFGGLGKRASACWRVLQQLLGSPSGPTQTTTRNDVKEALETAYPNASTRRSVVSDGVKELTERDLIQETNGVLTYGPDGLGWLDE